MVRGEVSDVETVTTLPDLDDLAEIVDDQFFLSVKVACEGKHPLIMSVAYRRPVNDLPYMETICGLIKDTVSAHPNCAHWFCGDLNLPDVNWENETVSGSQYSKQKTTFSLKLFNPAT